MILFLPLIAIAAILIVVWAALKSNYIGSVLLSGVGLILAAIAVFAVLIYVNGELDPSDAGLVLLGGTCVTVVGIGIPAIFGTAIGALVRRPLGYWGAVLLAWIVALAVFGIAGAYAITWISG